MIALIGGISSGISGGHSSSSTPPADKPAEPYISKGMAEEEVKKLLRDPESAQFSGVYVHRKGGVGAVCGSVNAKNGFGGYSGESLFFVIGTFAVIEPAHGKTQFLELFTEACTDAPSVKSKGQKSKVT